MQAAVYFNAHFIDTKDKGTGLLVAKGTFYRSFKMANEIVTELEQFLISTPKNKLNW